MASKINITFDTKSLRRFMVSSVIKRCVEATLRAEKIHTDCEINVLITDDRGIHAINLASRSIDRPTDVLSFPMFQFEPGNPPQDWEEYLDIGVNMDFEGIEKVREYAEQGQTLLAVLQQVTAQRDQLAAMLGMAQTT